MNKFIAKIMKKNVPDSWKVELLDNVAVRGTGHTPNKQHPDYWNGGIKWVSLADSNKLDNRFIYLTDKEISRLGIQNSSAVLHPKGTVILSRDAGVGMSALLGEEMAVSQHFIAWRCSEKLDNLYLYYWLQFMKPEFERMAVGSTIKTIGMGYFKKMEIILPDIEEQKRIAQTLSTWDEAIECLDELVAKVIRQKNYLVELSFSKEIAKKPLGKISLFIKDGTHGTHKDVAVGKYLLSAKDINNGKVYFGKDSRVISDHDFNQIHKKFKLKDGDVLLTIVGSIGRIAVLENYDESFTFQRSVVLIRTNKEVILPNYLATYLSSRKAQYDIEVRSNGLAQSGIYLGELAKLTIPILPLEDQKLVADATKAFQNKIDNLKYKKSLLQKQKKGLMQQLLIGKARPN